MAEPRECVRCKEIKIIKARNLCNKCYCYEKYHGRLDDYLEFKHKPRYDTCIDCSKYDRIYGRDRCKSCYKKWYRTKGPNSERWRQLHAERMRRHRAKNPEIYQEIERRRHECNRKARNERCRRYYAHNAEALREYASEYRKKNPDIGNEGKRRYRNRKRNLPVTLTQDEWESILIKYDYACAYCGTKDAQLIKEHWIPASRGGGYTVDNIVPACPSCNSRKWQRTGEEFLELINRKY